MIVATHNGEFHADEIFAIAILRKIFPNLEIIRSRDEKELVKADMRVDVGNKYDHKTNDFDHHQKGFNLERKNGILYSSCGLIWKHFGRKIVNSDKAYDYIDKNLIEFIDAEDNGVDSSKGNVKVYSIAEVIKSFNLNWNQKLDSTLLFNNALELAINVLDNEIKYANSIMEGEKIVKNALKKNNEEFIILPYAGLPKELLDDTNYKFYIFPGKSRGWYSVGIRLNHISFKRRKDFPKSWAGLTDENLEKVCGVKGAKFCHKNRFIIVANTKEAAIEMTKKALKSS